MLWDSKHEDGRNRMGRDGLKLGLGAFSSLPLRFIFLLCFMDGVRVCLREERREGGVPQFFSSLEIISLSRYMCV